MNGESPTNCLCDCPKENYCPFHKKELRVKTATEILRNRYGITDERIAEARKEAADEAEPVATGASDSENKKTPEIFKPEASR